MGRLPFLEENTMTDAQKQNIKEMRRQGVGYKRIAGSLGLSENTVKSFCQRNKLEVSAVSAAAQSMEIKPKCKHCGKTLEQTANKKPKTFCDDRCRYAWWNTNPAKQKSACHSVCGCCGKAFASLRSRNRKYCGNACYVASRFKGGIVCDQGAI